MCTFRYDAVIGTKELVSEWALLHRAQAVVGLPRIQKAAQALCDEDAYLSPPDMLYLGIPS